MIKKSALFLVAFFMIFGIIFSQSNFNISSHLPRVEKIGDQLVFSLDYARVEKDFYIYYRIPGIKNFQVRKMKTGKAGKAYYQLDTGTLYGKELEYFIMESGQGIEKNTLSPVFTIKNFTEKDSPDIYFQEVPGPAGSGGQTPKEPLVRVNASASAAVQLYDNAEYPGEKFVGSGNMRVYRNYFDPQDNSGFDFDSTFTLQNEPLEQETKLNLSSMRLSFKKGNHKIELGDISVSNTEFTTSYLTRRGLFYELTGKTLYINTFYTNSQQKTGFDGFGFPPSDANIFGATLGVNVGPQYTPLLKLRGSFMTGQDNQDSKTLVSAEEKFREGSMYSLWGEANLLKNHVNLKGEYSHSNFGQAGDPGDIEKTSDDAWRAGVGVNYGVFNAQANYQKVGSDFNSIANLFLQNDREGLTGNMGLSIKTFYVSVNYMDQKTNLNDPLQPMLRTKNLMANLTWSIGTHFRVGADFGFNNLDYDQSTGLQMGGTDMDTINYSGSLGYIAGANGITFRLGKTESKTFTSNLDGSVAITLMLGKFLTLNPTLSYQSTENLTDGSTSKIYNLYLNSELSFIPQTFTLTLMGSYSKTDNSLSDDSLSLSANANLNFYMAKIFKNKVQPVLSFRGRYQESEYGSLSTDSVALYLQFDLSF